MQEDSEPAPEPGRATPSPPPWTRRHSATSSRRLAAPSRRNSSSPTSPRGYIHRAWASAQSTGEYVLASYWGLTPAQRIGVAAGVTLTVALLALGVAFSGVIFEWMASKARSWREVPGGWLVIFFFIFATAIPPMIGYSTGCTLAGFVYDFPRGWALAASAAVLGSLVAFVASRTVLSASVHRMVGKDHRFIALGQVLRHDGILYLTAIRFCPLPFSLSNGFLATIPTITPLAFTLATALSTPKLLIHAFIGNRLRILAETGDKMSTTVKLVNYLAIAVGGIIGISVGYIIYQRTMRRAAELARETAEEEGEAGPYEDTEDTLADPEDFADVWPEDDVSLWETQPGDGYEDGEHEGGANGHKVADQDGKRP